MAAAGSSLKAVLPRLRSSRAAALVRLNSPRGAPLWAAAAVMLIGVALRAPTASFMGGSAHQFNHYIFQHVGAYSDVASLFFRHHLASHPAPYFDYRLEYPVLIGGFIWLVGFVDSSVTAYLIATAVVLFASGLVTVMLLGKLPGARPWLLALAPALALYVVLNWDLLAIALTVGALFFFHRNRDGWAGALLALAVWTKFFPVLCLAPLLLIRLREGRRREAGVLAGVFTVVGVAVNAPVAIRAATHGSGFVVRKSWEYFFNFNRDRPPQINLWTLHGGVHHHAAHWTPHQRVVHQLVQGAPPSGLTIPQINALSAALVLFGVAAIGYLVWRAVPRIGIGALAPALVATLAWFFFVNKVYSPQYGLWIIVVLALAGAPVRLAAAFAAVDLAWFLATFGTLAGDSFAQEQIYHAADLRELMVLVVVGWAVRRLVINGGRESSGGDAAGGTAAPAAGAAG